jgi:hypothetical protein
VWETIQQYTQHVITVGYFLSALASLVFVIKYASRKWWKSGAGRKMMILHLVMVGFGISSSLFLIIGPDWPGRIILSLALIAALNYVNWGWSLELHRAQEKEYSNA